MILQTFQFLTNTLSNLLNSKVVRKKSHFLTIKRIHNQILPFVQVEVMEEFVQASWSTSQPHPRKERRMNTPQADAMDDEISELVRPRPRSTALSESITPTRLHDVAFDLEEPTSSARVSPPAREQSPEPSYAQADRRGEVQC